MAVRSATEDSVPRRETVRTPVQDAGSKRSRTAIRRLTLGGIALTIVMFAIGGALLLGARQATWREARESSSNLALALERDVARTFSVNDLSLQGVADVLQTPGLMDISKPLRQAALFDRAATAEYLGSVLVLDPAGRVIEDSTSETPHDLNLSDRDYFVAQRDHPDTGLFVSLPFRSRLRNGDPSIAISRRISGRDGSFAGVAMVALRLAYFRHLFSDYNLGAQGTIALLHTSGRLIVRQPYSDSTIDKDVSQSEVFQRTALSTEGDFIGRPAIDGLERLVTFHRVGNLPLIIVVAKSIHDIYAPWRVQAVYTGFVLLFLCGSTAGLCVLSRREFHRRLATEQRLQESASALAVAAATDGLTGLANRREFDRALEREWRRSLRNGAQMAVLLLDADKFKLYNDRYGHQGGDTVLKSIASCIYANTRRPADIAARYGGEEFAVILPETNALGALTVAETIRHAVVELNLEHADSPIGHVSVSIGVSVLRPRPDLNHSFLVTTADASLYRAKHAGRNCVILYEGNAEGAAAQRLEAAAATRVG